MLRTLLEKECTERSQEERERRESCLTINSENVWEQRKNGGETVGENDILKRVDRENRCVHTISTDRMERE